MIVRIRLRTRDVSVRFPFRLSYLIPAAREKEIYTLFGVAFSVRLTPSAKGTLRGTPSDHVKAQKWSGAPGDVNWLSMHRDWRDEIANQELRVVVPLYNTNAFVAPQIHPIPGRYLFDSDCKTLRAEIVTAIPPLDALLHVSPTQTQQICTFCPFLTRHLVQGCTPGEADCHKNLVIPVDSLVRVSR